MSAPTHLASFDLVEHLRRQREFSAKAFGPHPRLNGVVAHIRKELEEIEAKPLDLSEWVDVVLLALDGAWRAGHSPEAIAGGIAAKQTKNEARTWPDWRRAAEDAPIEHDRSGEAQPISAQAKRIAQQSNRVAELEAEGDRLAAQVLKLKASHHEILERLTDLSTAITRRHERAKKGIAELANLVISTTREP